MPPERPQQDSNHVQWFADEVKPHEPALRTYLRNRFPKERDVDDTAQVKVIGEFMSEKYLKHWGENTTFTQQYDPNSSASGTPLLAYPWGTEIQFGVPFRQGGITTLGLLPRTFTFAEEDAFVRNDKQAGTLSLETQITPEWSLRVLGNAHWWDHMAMDYIPQNIQRNNRIVPRNIRPIANDDFTATFALDSVFNFALFGGQHKLLSIMQSEYQSNSYPIWGAAPGTPQPHAIDLFNPVHLGYTPTALVLTQNQYSNNYKFGFATQDHAKFIGDKLQLIAGVRWDWFASQTKNLLLTSNQNGNRNTGADWSFKYGAVFKPIRALSVFLNHSETYNPNFGVQPDGTSFDHQQGKIDEIGVKSALLDGRVAGSIALYQLKLENIVENDPDPVRAAAGWRTLSAYHQVKGGEVDLFLTVTPNWQINMGTGILDMKLPTGVGQAALHGDKLITRNLATTTASGWTRYDFRSGPLKGMAVGGGVSYKNKIPVDANNLFFFPAVTTADAFVQYGWGKYRVALNVSNIMDEQYIMRSVAALQMFYGPERLIKLRVSRKF